MKVPVTKKALDDTVLFFHVVEDLLQFGAWSARVLGREGPVPDTGARQAAACAVLPLSVPLLQHVSDNDHGLRGGTTQEEMSGRTKHKAMVRPALSSPAMFKG